MSETTQLRSLMEAVYNYGAEGQSKVLYVFVNGKITELDTRDEVAMARFNNTFGFDSTSIYDFPVERGVRTFRTRHHTVLVSDDPQALAAEVEAQS